MQQNLSAPASVSGLDENAIFNKGHTNVPKANSESGSFCPGKMVTCLTKSMDTWPEGSETFGGSWEIPIIQKTEQPTGLFLGKSYLMFP